MHKYGAVRSQREKDVVKQKEVSLCAKSFRTGELSGAATELIKDDERIENILLHEQQPHVKLFKPHHMGRI